MSLSQDQAYDSHKLAYPDHWDDDDREPTLKEREEMEMEDAARRSSAKAAWRGEL